MGYMGILLEYTQCHIRSTEGELYMRWNKAWVTDCVLVACLQSEAFQGWVTQWDSGPWMPEDRAVLKLEVKHKGNIPTARSSNP